MDCSTTQDDEVRFFFSVCLFLGSCILKGTFMSILVNCKTVSFYLHAWFAICSCFGHYPGNTYYGKFKISFAIPK